jgi:hypothetical protein
MLAPMITEIAYDLLIVYRDCTDKLVSWERRIRCTFEMMMNEVCILID